MRFSSGFGGNQRFSGLYLVSQNGCSPDDVLQSILELISILKEKQAKLNKARPNRPYGGVDLIIDALKKIKRKHLLEYLIFYDEERASLF